MSREIDHIAGETGPQNSAHQIGGGCTLCFAFIPLIIGFMGTRDACSEPLSLYLIVRGLLQVLFGGLQSLSKGDPQSTYGRISSAFQGFAMVWSILGIYWAFGTSATLCTARLYYTSMIFAWMTVIGILCMCCCMVFMAGAMAGQMEKDAMVAHGCGQFLKERMMETSDITMMHVCDECGMFAQKAIDKDYYVCPMPKCRNSRISEVVMPYACKLLFQELMAVNILPKIETERSIYGDNI